MATNLKYVYEVINTELHSRKYSFSRKGGEGGGGVGMGEGRGEGEGGGSDKFKQLENIQMKTEPSLY